MRAVRAERPAASTGVGGIGSGSDEDADAREAGSRDPHESLRSMTPDSDSLLFWRVRVMTLEKLESQSHDSERVGESAIFTGFMTLGEPDFRPFSARNGPIFGRLMRRRMLSDPR